MSNRDRRRQLRAERAEQSLQAELATPRDIDAALLYPGSGDVLLRLAWVPSFEVCVVWEVRSCDGTLVAYRSQGQVPGERFVVGHQRLPLDLPLARLSGARAWHYRRGSLLVNGEVRKALLALSLWDLSFSPGFSQFG